MRQLPPLNALRAFDAVSRRGGIGPAASELAVTPSAVSQHIANLESWMGQPLLQRAKNRTSLTVAGDRFAEAIKAVFDQLEQEVARARHDRRAGEVLISVLPSFAAQWLVKRLTTFGDLHPDVRIKIEATYALVDFTADGPDLAIRSGSGAYPGLTSIPLLKERVAPVCSPRLIARHGPIGSLEDVLRLPLLEEETHGIEGTNLSWTTWIGKTGGVEGGSGEVRQAFSDTHLTTQAALSGVGCMLGRTALIADELAAGTLVAPLDLWEDSDFPYHIVHPKNVALRPEVRKFINWLRRTAASEGTDPTGAPSRASRPPR